MQAPFYEVLFIFIVVVCTLIWIKKSKQLFVSILPLIFIVIYFITLRERINDFYLCEQQRVYINYISSTLNEIEKVGHFKPYIVNSSISHRFLYNSHINFFGYSCIPITEFPGTDLAKIKFLYYVNNSPGNYNYFLYKDMIKYFSQNNICENTRSIFFADYLHTSKFLYNNRIIIYDYLDAEKFWDQAFRAWNATK